MVDLSVLRSNYTWNALGHTHTKQKQKICQLNSLLHNTDVEPYMFTPLKENCC